ncbi:MAG: OmpH family outer membrane protein [Bacteroidia bacterium]|nr:OmpH family outer membrane protein [Bacteroidia bacterium]
MKNILKSAVALFAVMIIAGSSVKAQKIGYVDLQELMQLMPDYKKANMDMEAFGKSLEDELKKMSEEFQKKVADYQKNEKLIADPIKEVKQKELQDMQSRIQEFQQSAQENVRKKEAELLKPIIEKAKTAIGHVAKEGGFSYIFDSSVAGFLYKPEGDNVLPIVKKKLGIL